ncbi:hypothetical protein JCM19239_1584 [Vibrio variabilis]|uniref:Lipoprotein n=1 Tax=Vibrio variabilis TaxID=990271 RepID=A0ABQ0JIB2_9VIBR|nr:hypothetical protein JCM19239_1584 [Vibrio variabilis]
MKKLTLIAVLALAGCATAQPNYFNGKHYMTGDSDCRYAQQTANPEVIMCLNEDMERTGTRQAMSDIQVQAWYSKQGQSSSVSSSVQCKQIGVISSEIKTFSGGVCPIGWMKAY